MSAAQHLPGHLRVPAFDPDQAPAPIVFLDFDGVTHPEVCRADQLFCCLPLIEAVLRHHANAEIVISSTWRYAHSLSELRGYFASDIAARVAGTTPLTPMEHPKRAGGAVRQAECQEWLTANRPGHPWVALDDVPWNFTVGCPNLILTHHPVGFTPANAAHLSQVLQRLSP